MTFLCEERAADSPLVQKVWQVQHEASGHYLVPAHGSWDLLVMRHGHDTQLFFGGPKTKAMPIPYSAGSLCHGIRFRVGAYLTRLPAQGHIDVMKRQRGATQRTFWFDDAMLPLPDYDNAEGFVARLERLGLLAFDPFVGTALHDRVEVLSERSVQRRFLRTTGLTRATLRQIARVNQAAALLEQGRTVSDVVHEVGYTDQAHFTKALKRFVGYTPVQFKQRYAP